MEFSEISKTLLLPLIGRAIHSKKKHHVIYDSEAIKFLNVFKDSCQPLIKLCSGLYELIWVARAHYFEVEINKFINQFPEAKIINLGAGLDTTFYRVDNKKISWINIDLPDVIKIRTQYLSHNGRMRDIAISILEESWINSIKDYTKSPCLFVAGGLFFYFSENQVRKILNQIILKFPQAVIIFDTISSRQLGKTNARISKMKISNVEVKWAIDSANDIAKLLPNGYIVNKMSYFNNLKYNKKISLITRLRMSLNDVLSKNGFIKINPIEKI